MNPTTMNQLVQDHINELRGEAHRHRSYREASPQQRVKFAPHRLLTGALRHTKTA